MNELVGDFDSEKRAKRAAKIGKLMRIEQMMLRGITNAMTIANAFNISRITARKYMTRIYDSWAESCKAESRDARSVRVNQLESVLQYAINSFERSRRDVEEFSIVNSVCDKCSGLGHSVSPGHAHHSERDKLVAQGGSCVRCGSKADLMVVVPPSSQSPFSVGSPTRLFTLKCVSCFNEHKKGVTASHCLDCSGTGKGNTQSSRCFSCDGTGVEIKTSCLSCSGEGKISIQTTRVKGQSGDSSFLSVAKDCIKELARLEGISTRGGLTVAVKNIIRDGSGLNLEVQPDAYLEAPVDAIIRAKAAIDYVRNKGTVVQSTASVKTSEDKA